MGWYFLTMAHNFGVMRSGRVPGTREPRRISSRWGMVRRRLQNPFEEMIRKEQRVPAGENDIANFGMFP